MRLPILKLRKTVSGLLIGMAFLVSPAWGAELISRAEWPVVRSGNTLIQMPSLQRVMAQYDKLEQGTIIIRFPGGDRGNAWALKLRDWLVALGVSSKDILLEPGSGIPETLVLYAEQRGG